jgi:CIC family chloride channel protein
VPISLGSVVTEQWFLGDAPLFRVPPYHLVHGAERLAYAALDVIGGTVSIVFVKAVGALRPRLRAWPPWTWYLQPVAAGLLIGAIALRFPQVMGAGYEYIDQAMHDQYGWRALLALCLLKAPTTTASFVSGTPGGLFAPTLFIGAMLGGAVCAIERIVAPGLTGPIGAYALVGMGTTFAGILRAPMTSVFMIIEVSGNHSIILPVMISNTIAYLLSRQFQPHAQFDLLSRQDGTLLPSMEEEREERIRTIVVKSPVDASAGGTPDR